MSLMIIIFMSIKKNVKKKVPNSLTVLTIKLIVLRFVFAYDFKQINCVYNSKIYKQK